MLGILFGVATGALAVSMIPQVVRSIKTKTGVAPMSAIITTISIGILTYCFWFSGDTFAAISEGIATILWGIILYYSLGGRKT